MECPHCQRQFEPQLYPPEVEELTGTAISKACDDCTAALLEEIVK